MEEHLSVRVYLGHHSETLFLKSLLEASGIPAAVTSLAEVVGETAQSCVSVAPIDVARAQPLLEDFRRHGKKSV